MTRSSSIARRSERAGPDQVRLADEPVEACRAAGGRAAAQRAGPGRRPRPRRDRPSVTQGYPRRSCAPASRYPPRMTTPPEKPALRLGGMALENGLLVHGPTHWAAAIRDEDGDGARRLRCQDRHRRHAAPRARPADPRRRQDGRDAAGAAATCGASCPAARLPFERPSLVVASAAGAIATAGARRSGRLSPAAVEALAGTFALLPALVALRSENLAALPRRRAQDHRRVRERRRGRGRAEGARPLRLAPRRPAHGRLRHRQHRRLAPAATAPGPGPRRRVAGRGRRRRRGLRLDEPPRRAPAPRASWPAPGTSSSASSARASRRRTSSRWRAPRSTACSRRRARPLS